MALVKNNNGSVDVGDLITLGQAIDWIKGYRLGMYDNIGWNADWRQQRVIDLMKDGGRDNPMIEVSQSGTPIPAYVFYSEDAIANLTDSELLSLYQLASTTHPISAVEYWHTDEQWQSKPFMSINYDRKNPIWRGTRPDPYGSVQKWSEKFRNSGPQMPLGKFGDPDTSNLRREIIKSELTRPDIVSVSPDPSSNNFKTWVWRGPSAVPVLDIPKEVKVSTTVRSTSATGATFSANIENTNEANASVKTNWQSASSANAKITGVDASLTNNSQIESQVASSWKIYSQNKSSEEIKDETFTETIRDEQFIDQEFKKIDWENDSVTLTADEYYQLYSQEILARPNDPARSVNKDGKKIMIDGALVTYGKQTLVAQSRSSLVTEVDYTGSALGSFFQGMWSSMITSYTQLFVSNNNVTRTAPNAPADQKLGDVIAFQDWLKRDGKNRVDKIYDRLQSLNFIKRIWGEDDLVRKLNIGESSNGSSESEKVQLISSPNNGTLKTYTIKPLDQTTEVQTSVFEQKINGKSLSEYVLDRATSEGKLVPAVGGSTILGSPQKLSGRTNEVSSNGFYTQGKKARNTLVDIANINNAFIGLGKDVDTDRLTFENTPTRSGSITISDYDLHRDSVTGMCFENATWSVDYSSKTITATLALAQESEIQFEVNFVIPFDKFKEENGRFFEKRNSEYSLDSALRTLQASTATDANSPYLKSIQDLQSVSAIPESGLIL